jgi:hypothetical protein
MAKMFELRDGHTLYIYSTKPGFDMYKGTT